MYNYKVLKGWFAVLLISAILVSFNIGAGAQPMTPIIIAQPGHDDYGIPLYLADKLGYFGDAGLKVEFVNFKSSPLSIASLLAGEVQFCLTSYDQALKTFEKGKILKILFTTTETHPWCIIARPEIQTVRDLKGKRISAKMPGSGPRAFVSNVLIHYGLNPAKDVIFVDLPGTAVIPAYANGGIDCTLSSGVNKAEFIKRGAVVLVDMNDPAQHKEILGTKTFPLKVVLSRDDYISTHPEIAQKLVNAVLRAMKWEAKHSSKEIASEVEPYFLGTLNADIIDDVRRAFSHTGLITEAGHKAIEKQSIGVGLISNPVPMDKVVDLSFLKSALANLSE
jgi:NitT/TauT family transport system substrate-binding protein